MLDLHDHGSEEAHDLPNKSSKMNTAGVQIVATPPSTVLMSRLNEHTLGRRGMILNDNTDAHSNVATCRVIQSRTEKTSSYMTHPRAPDHFHRHSQIFPSADGITARRTNKSSLLHSMELNQRGTNTDVNPTTEEMQGSARRTFFQKEIISAEATMVQPISSCRPAPDNTASPTTICGSVNSTNNEDVGAPDQAPDTSCLLNKSDLKISTAIAHGDEAVLVAVEDDIVKNHSDSNNNSAVVNAKDKDSNAPATRQAHADPLEIRAMKSSRGISAYFLARQNQTAAWRAETDSAAPPSASPSSRRKHSMLAPIPHYSTRHRAALSNFLSNATRRKLAEGTLEMRDAMSGDATTQKALDIVKDAYPSSLSLHKLTSTPCMTNLVKPDTCKTQSPIANNKAAMAKRSLQARKAMAVYLSKYPVLRIVAKEMGFTVQETESELNEYRFNLCWSDTVLNLTRLVRLGNWQRSNHFPSMFLLCQKSHLCTTLGRMKRKMPAHFQFFPSTWSLSTERFSFQTYFNDLKQRRVSKYFIIKPSVGSQGRGIVVTNDPLGEVGNVTNCVVQEYIYRPLLFEGRKFDLRVYVLLTSIREPSIFLFNDGLVRICAEPYETPSVENSKNSFKHLTNYAINKRSSNYVFNTDVDKGDIGNKRNFKFMNSWLESEGYSVSDFWERVSSLVVKTIMSAQPKISQVYDACFPGYNEGYSCFEVLGFDVLVDDKLKPWLLEVNHTPSFATDTPLDLDIKSRLLREVLDIVGCSANDRELERLREREEFTHRNMPPWTKNNTHHSQWDFALNVLRQSSGDTNNKGKDAGALSPIKTILQRQDNEDRGASALQPLVSQPESDAELFTELVRLRREREDERLINFSRIYPSSDPDIQSSYEDIRKMAAAILIPANGAVRSSYSSRSSAALFTTRAAPSAPLNVQQLHELQRSIQDLKEGEKGRHRNLSNSALAIQTIPSRTPTASPDSSATLQKATLHNKLSGQPETVSPSLENAKTDAQSPSHLSESLRSGDVKSDKTDDVHISKNDPSSPFNAVIPPSTNETSMAVDGDSPQVSSSVPPETNTKVNDDHAEPTPTPGPTDTGSLRCPERQPVPTLQTSALNEDVSCIQDASDPLATAAISLCSLANETSPVKQATPQDSAMKPSSTVQSNHEESPAHFSEHEPSVEELCGPQTPQQHLNVAAAKDATECESFDLSD